MSEQLIISISREYGSAGHVIAEKLAERFDLPIYDRKLLEEIANEKNLNIEEIEKYDERPKKPIVSRTVRAHQAASHQGKGWEKFTDAVIEAVNTIDRPVVFILWGKPAQTKKKMLNNPKHFVLEAPHPSPLSAYRGFFGSKPFSKTNDFLEKNGLSKIDWQIENV